MTLCVKMQRRAHRHESNIIFQSIGTHLVTSASTGKIGRKLRECLASGVSFGARDVKTSTLVAVRLSYTTTKGQSANEEPVDEEKSEYEVRRVMSFCPLRKQRFLISAMHEK